MSKINRRTFNKYLLFSVPVLSCPGLSCCVSGPYNRINNIRSEFLNEEENFILHYASMAPSGHNAQPWLIYKNKSKNWFLAVDSKRVLEAVDPDRRETLLSLGCFVENLSIAASCKGYAANIKFDSATDSNDIVAEIILSKQIVKGSDKEILSLLSKRRTIRTGHLNRKVSTFSMDKTEIESENIFFYDSHSQQGKKISELTFESNQLQISRLEAQKELADWIRWSDEDIVRYRDGLNPETLELSSFQQAWTKRFYTRSDVLTKRFKNASLKKVKEQLSSFGGWLVISSESNSPEDLLNAGRRAERLWIKAQKYKLAVHPMSQALEERKTKELLKKALRPKGEIQFLLRVSHIDNYPAPISPRRPVSWFVYQYQH